MHKQLHIVPGYFAADLLRQGLNLEKEDVLAFEDFFDGGPIVDFTLLDEWSARRKNYWNNVIELEGDEFPKLFQHSHDEETDFLPSLTNANEIILWVGGDVREQLYLLCVFRLLQYYQLDLSKLRIIEAYPKVLRVTGIGVYTPEQLKAFYDSGKRRTLDEQDIAELKMVWNAITAPSPGTLMQCYNFKTACFPHLAETISHFIRRYPDKHTGLNLQQTLLLKYAQEKGPRAVAAIGYAMGYMDEHSLDFVGDLYLFHELKVLGNANLPHPALTLSGNLSDMRETEVHLTDMGRQFLEEKANFVQLNGLDYWVGGVHLTPENLWYYDNGKLIRS